MAESTKADRKNKKVLRREFLTGSGAALAAGALVVSASEATVFAQPQAAAAKPSYEASTGYIVYDSRLCLGCQSCMFACSMTHEGAANPSLSRIQIIRDAPSFTKYPYDVVMSVCRQCVSPLCVQNCPTGACHVDAANGNVRRIDQSKCIGCKRCIQACPQRPHRTIWNSAKKKSTKCDLCADAPYWSQKGGPDGKQACVETCAAKALKLVREAPPQSDIAGYDVNLAPPAKTFPKMAPKPAPKEGA
ncbi:MAG TPA: 4Fe-4S dicluster domain-containing protein [Acidobacteriota bacterium]|nr:4Fe-4S dicluster domain-containing protein [Acidobacteriota bacterium]